MADETARIDPAAPAPSPAASTVPEQRFGHVLIQKKLGAGGMGEVLLGFHEGFQIPVVVKLLPERFEDTALVERFLREAQVAVRLEHPNIVRVFDVGREHGRAYMIMEHVDGKDLEEHAKLHGGRLPVADALRFIGQAARGLAYAHGHGVIHRDIKPANLVLRASDQVVKVLDFGLARAQAMDQLTDAAALMGTLPYMPLEQLQGHAEAPADVYSLGVSLYRLLAGRLPAVGTFEDLMRYHTEGSPAPLSTYRPVPERVEALVKRMLARAPEARPSAEGVAKEIDALLLGMGSAAVSEPVISPSAARMAEDMLSSAPAGPDIEPTLVKTSTPPIPSRRVPRAAIWLTAGAVAVSAALTLWPHPRPVTPPGPPAGTVSAGERDLAVAVLITQGPTRSLTNEDFTDQQVPGAALDAFHDAVIHSGEGLRFAIRTAVPLYVYAFAIDTAGQAACMFPDFYNVQHAKWEAKGEVEGNAPSNPLAPEGDVIVVPPLATAPGGMRKAWWYTADKSVGPEWCLIVAARAPVPELEELRKRQDLASRAEELRSLASRWRANLKGPLERKADQLGWSIRTARDERHVEPGWSYARSAGPWAWTLELDHQR